MAGQIPVIIMFRTIVASLALAASVSAGTSIFQTFEGDGFDDWQVEGEAFGLAPSTGKTDDMGQAFNGYSDDSLACSGHGGMQATGSLTSPGFVIREPYIAFLIAGGNQPGKTAAQLLIDGKTVRETTGERGMRCKPGFWDVSEY